MRCSLSRRSLSPSRGSSQPGSSFLLRRPPEPPIGHRTLELGTEPPAVANFLVNDFRVTDDAVPATLIDLAARNVVDVEQRGPGVFYVRLRPTTDERLNAYEQRVFDHLRGRASDGVVPAEALTTGPGQESVRWRRRFGNEVIADAKARGLSRDALDGPVFTVLSKPRYYVAVDDGLSRTVRAWRVNPRHCLGLTQGETIIVAMTKNLGCVRWITREQDRT